MDTLTPHATVITNIDRSLSVVTTWESPRLDRTDGLGFRVKAHQRELAERLVRAINAGVVFRDATICTDLNYNTYVEATSAVMTRYLDADLKRLGF